MLSLVKLEWQIWQHMCDAASSAKINDICREFNWYHHLSNSLFHAANSCCAGSKLDAATTLQPDSDIRSRRSDLLACYHIRLSFNNQKSLSAAWRPFSSGGDEGDNCMCLDTKVLPMQASNTCWLMVLSNVFYMFKHTSSFQCSKNLKIAKRDKQMEPSNATSKQG